MAGKKNLSPRAKKASVRLDRSDGRSSNLSLVSARWRDVVEKGGIMPVMDVALEFHENALRSASPRQLEEPGSFNDRRSVMAQASTLMVMARLKNLVHHLRDALAAANAEAAAGYSFQLALTMTEWQVNNDFSYAAHVGKKTLESFQKATDHNAAEQNKKIARAKALQILADVIWSKHPTWFQPDVAAEILKRHSKYQRWKLETIAKLIKKPRKAAKPCA